jgi:hypothetical protein
MTPQDKFGYLKIYFESSMTWLIPRDKFKYHLLNKIHRSIVFFFQVISPPNCIILYG